MTDEHADDVHGTEDHGADGGHDDHGHAEEPLGPIDVGKWSAGVAACFAFSTGYL